MKFDNFIYLIVYLNSLNDSSNPNGPKCEDMIVGIWTDKNAPNVNPDNAIDQNLKTN